MNKKITILAMLFLLIAATSRAQTDSAKQAGATTLKATVVDLNDVDQQSTSLDDVLAEYKGQVVYLDFWASWCGPCKKEMPHSQSLKKELSDKNVAFVYISTDKNLSQWKNAIETLKISGDHYRASIPFRNQIVEKFNLQYIPRYVLINKEGEVVDQNAKRPSNPAVVSDIEKLL